MAPETADAAIEDVLDAEQPIHEVTTLLNAASLLNRCSSS